MKELISELRRYISGYKAGQWLLLCIVCAISVSLNYLLDIQRRIYDKAGLSEYVAYVVLYGVHIYSAYLLTCYFSGDCSFFRTTRFHILIFSAVCIFSFRSVFVYHRELIEALSCPGFKRINRYVYNDLFRFIMTVLPVGFVWFVFQRKEMPLYGFRARHVPFRVYITMLLIMIPLIAAASFTEDFLSYYPRVRRLVLWGASVEKLILFEMMYGLDFFSIEFFFRGFMVLAFIPFAGKHAIIPMAVFYMSIHYGKPAGEAVSSFFGGLLLGLVSYKTRSIAGGIFVHVGIAWLMELGAYMGNLISGNWP